MAVTTLCGYYTSSSVPAPVSIEATNVRINNIVNGNFEVFGRNKKVYRENDLKHMKSLTDNEFYEKEKYYEDKKNQLKKQKPNNVKNANEKFTNKKRACAH